MRELESNGVVKNLRDWSMKNHYGKIMIKWTRKIKEFNARFLTIYQKGGREKYAISFKIFGTQNIYFLIYLISSTWSLFKGF